MKCLRLGAAVLNQTPLDWDGNLRRILGALSLARSQEVDVLCLPELCITGYGCEDAFHAGFVAQTALTLLAEVAKAAHGMVLSVGLPFAYHHSLFNVAALIVEGKVCGLLPKQNLAGDGIHYEPRWFKAWTKEAVAEVSVLGARVPIGDLVFDVGGVRIGFEICEDAWVAQRPGAALAQVGVDIILNPSASHFAFGKAAVRERFVLEGSRAFGVSYVYTNLLGNEAGRVIYDGGALIASNGELCARGARLTLSEYELTHAVVDLDLARMAHARTASFRPELTEPKGLVTVDHPWVERKLENTQVQAATWERGPWRKHEELARALSLGLFDYMRKSRTQGFVVSASGGADSSAVVCLVHIMAQRLLQELGPEELEGRLPNLTNLRTSTGDARALTGRLLTTLYQATESSGETTRAAARLLAAAVGARHLELDVSSIVHGYTQLVERALERRLGWDSDDLALQNIQARARGPSAWLVANVHGALLLATSNRSEAALGYATMDGDTCGGLSPIAGIDKAFLRDWLRWLEREGPHGLVAIPALSVVNTQASTPELRPMEAEQTSEQDLMPFWLLDRIERHAVRDRRSPAETLRALRAEQTGLDDEAIASAVSRFYRLFAQNQWKRERYAPSFHLDDENLDPKSWFRFPILSGRFERELSGLAEV